MLFLRGEAHPGWNEDENVDILLRIYRIISMRQQYRSSAIRSTLTQFGNMSARYGSLLELIASFSSTQGLDPRDKVYALMSLETERQGSWKQQIFHKIRPDYEKDPMKLFVEICYLRLMAYDGFARDPGLGVLPSVFDALGLDKQVDGLRMIDYLLSDNRLFTNGGEYEIYVLSNLARMLVFRLGASSNHFQNQKTVSDYMTALRQWRTDYDKAKPNAMAQPSNYPSCPAYNPHVAAMYSAEVAAQSYLGKAYPAYPSYSASFPAPTDYSGQVLDFPQDEIKVAVKARSARRRRDNRQ